MPPQLQLGGVCCAKYLAGAKAIIRTGVNYEMIPSDPSMGKPKRTAASLVDGESFTQMFYRLD